MEFVNGGNLLEANVDAVVNTVNTKGVMGKGIALQFKRAFPSNYKQYRAACEAGEVRLGEMFVTETGRLGNPWLVINFPTKAHWKSRSRLTDIETGLKDLRHVLLRRGSSRSHSRRSAVGWVAWTGPTSSLGSRPR